MTWPPQQDPCTEPCCTGGDFQDSESWPEPPSGPVVIREPDLRECGVTNCTQCDPVYQWIRDTDPDPAPPPGGGARLPNRKATT